MEIVNVVAGVTVIGLFSIWLALSVASQIIPDRVHAMFPRLSVFGLIPAWTFFAPRPGVHDIHLLYRDRSADGTVTGVMYIPTIPGRRWFHFIWNPRKYENKILADCIASLFEQLHALKKSDRDLRAILLSSSYLTLLNIVMHMPPSSGAEARQFVIAENARGRRLNDRHISFISEFHRFEGVLV
ncbi:hypothetical protein ACLMAJ_16975 [Nocardia sp. KC 131]|uniref:hypothetical protein n=1 Tax=Nocardia arseniciresistens TaxID=3392119 RepID=UPI00398ECB61